MLERLRKALLPVTVWDWLALLVFVLGSALRVEHALTFDQVNRASDYDVHLLGVHWMQEHWRAFNHSPSVNYQVRSYPPLWYYLSALILNATHNARALVSLTLLGWFLRHAVLWRTLNELIPDRPLARLAGLAIHALLPLGVLIDGKVNPEGFHSGVFAVALYALFRIERDSQASRAPSVLAGATFGALAGVALLAKITGAMLVVMGPAVFCVQALKAAREGGLKLAWRRLAAPALAAGLAWWLIVGNWTYRNLRVLGHPFPHVWDMEGPAQQPILAEPIWYRRPLGWALPFEWKEYWSFPILRTLSEPRPNFWATEVMGTWSDIYNRGFCRLKGGTITDKVWGGRGGALSMNSDVWDVNSRCVEWFASMTHVGVWISAAAVAAVLFCLWQHLSSFGGRYSLALAGVPILCTFSAMKFALAYPYDNIACLNPRYLLSQVMPMSACLALLLAEFERRGVRHSPAGRAARWALRLICAAIAVIGVMLVWERWGI